jgi:hypothetical protein
MHLFGVITDVFDNTKMHGKENFTIIFEAYFFLISFIALDILSVSLDLNTSFRILFSNASKPFNFYSRGKQKYHNQSSGMCCVSVIENAFCLFFAQNHTLHDADLTNNMEAVPTINTALTSTNPCQRPIESGVVYRLKEELKVHGSGDVGWGSIGVGHSTNCHVLRGREAETSV